MKESTTIKLTWMINLFIFLKQFVKTRLWSTATVTLSVVSFWVNFLHYVSIFARHCPRASLSPHLLCPHLLFWTILANLKLTALDIGHHLWRHHVGHESFACGHGLFCHVHIKCCWRATEMCPFSLATCWHFLLKLWHRFECLTCGQVFLKLDTSDH